MWRRRIAAATIAHAQRIAFGAPLMCAARTGPWLSQVLGTMTALAPIAFEVDIKSPAPAAKTPVQLRLEKQMSPKDTASPANLEERLAKSEEARKVSLRLKRAGRGARGEALKR